MLCEKPFGIRLAEVEEMTAAAQRAGIATAIAFEYRYNSALQALKELIVNGHLPALREIEVAGFGSSLRAKSPRPPSSWWFDASKGGGLANAGMPHIADSRSGSPAVRSIGVRLHPHRESGPAGA